ncbi:hypothetical protein NA57DRAFT_75509 [Rhizodiscina lignyota]|uniref:ELYS-like domain-containing protein n=1 Tax=Rhizodiscina lignyota TaxID=1504668 RepID=A0A9P4IK71_9PEZI|nr:hypothetical protein NA57DRAFT_75509 [Rhizodiscina lignyota]
MLDVKSFDAIFSYDPRTHYLNDRLGEINKCRHTLDVLFIERLLDSLGLKHAAQLYAPRDNRGLRELHHEIVTSNIAMHHKQALLYYILMDVQHPDEEEAERFANEVDLPQSYRWAIMGFWEMDQLDFRSAMDHLTHPSLLPTFSSDILAILLVHSKDRTLPLAYHHAVSPPLPLGSDLRQRYFQYLVSLSVKQAFFFTRSQPDRQELFKALIKHILTEKASAARADQAVDLVDLPMDAEEQEWWEDFLTGKGHGLPKAKDTLNMRDILTGREGRLLLPKKDRSDGTMIDGVDWSTFRSGVSKAMGPRSGMTTKY